MGITTSTDAGNFTSISDAGTIKIIETHSGTIVSEMYPVAGQTHALKQLVDLKTRNCIAICDAKGQLHIYNKSKSPIEK